MTGLPLSYSMAPHLGPPTCPRQDPIMEPLGGVASYGRGIPVYKQRPRWFLEGAGCTEPFFACCLPSAGPLSPSSTSLCHSSALLECRCTSRDTRSQTSVCQDPTLAAETRRHHYLCSPAHCFPYGIPSLLRNIEEPPWMPASIPWRRWALRPRPPGTGVTRHACRSRGSMPLSCQGRLVAPCCQSEFSPCLPLPWLLFLPACR